ncbi:MAG: hypothetical protein JKY60_11615 [Kordiimonadaceae bacterium]|nr:hypothetical protein [Kordiimonadaceae bacterium]
MKTIFKAILLSIPLLFAFDHPLYSQDEGDLLVNKFKKDLENSIDVVGQLGAMNAKEQHARFLIINLFKNPDLSHSVRKRLQDEGGKLVDGIDKENLALLREILKTHTWRELADISAVTVGNAWTIVQHSNDLEFQKDTLKKVEPLVKAGKMKGYALANMLDRIAATENRPQRYGTQSDCIDGKTVIYQIEDPENVDERRKAIGLGTLAVYLEGLKKVYGETCS